MNINRQNYEELFLMYVDNELTEAQRTEVEVFVQQNPDLAEELVILKESVLSPEQITFSGKEELYKTDESININNYEEYFLLDVDNELSVADKHEVEKFVLQHPKLQDEFTLLHQTKLQPEVIEFKNKASLYRTEERRRVIPMNFMRFAVAASVIGLIATLWMFYPDNNGDVQPLASNEKPATKTPSNIQPQQTTEFAKEVEPANEVYVERTLTASNKVVDQNIKPKNVVSNTVNRLPENEPEPEQIFAAVSPKQQTAQKVREDIYSETNKATISAEPTMAINASNNSTNNSNASYAQPAVYNEVDTDDEDNSFYIGSAEINKAKLRGLFKKAATLFDKKAKTDDSEKSIRIASFEIKTK